MKNESFAQAHSGRCPGCGIRDYGLHIGHRYNTADGSTGCTHRYHDDLKCDEPTVIKRQLARIAKFHAYLRKELGQIELTNNLE